MQYINDKTHYATLISSLNKEYLNAKLGKVLKPNNIYTLDIVYNLLNNSNLILSKKEQLKLTQLYSELIQKSKNICSSDIKVSCELTKRKITIQSKKSDCQNIITPEIPGIIYYWQEESALTTIEDIEPLTYNLGYFTNKLSDSYSNFENTGKTINYEYFGKICFYATKSDNKIFEITDILNNEVSDIFDIVYLQDVNSTLFVSKDAYSSSNIFFKFKKTNVTSPIVQIEYNFEVTANWILQNITDETSFKQYSLSPTSVVNDFNIIEIESNSKISANITTEYISIIDVPIDNIENIKISIGNLNYIEFINCNLSGKFTNVLFNNNITYIGLDDNNFLTFPLNSLPLLLQEITLNGNNINWDLDTLWIENAPNNVTLYCENNIVGTQTEQLLLAKNWILNYPVVLKSFQISQETVSDLGAIECERGIQTQPTLVTAYHNGLNSLPVLGDIVYLDASGTTLYPTGLYVFNYISNTSYQNLPISSEGLTEIYSPQCL